MSEYELAVEKNVLAARKFLNEIGCGEISAWEEYKIAEAEFDVAFETNIDISLNTEGYLDSSSNRFPVTECFNAASRSISKRYTVSLIS